jgi:peptidoglycan/xylan/chitin deacetylase (PgdA/CDA1 family)
MEMISREYRPTTLDDVHLFLTGRKDLPPRAVAVTFDDGYTDNYDTAAPILNDLGIPATFYLTVDCVEKGSLPWPARLRRVLLASSVPNWRAPGGGVWPLKDREQRNQVFAWACEHGAKLAGGEQERWVQSLEAELGNGHPTSNERWMMTWDQARTLARRGHSVGSHSMTHPNMAYVSLKEAERELKLSKHRLEQALGVSIVHFSYPCPALSPHWKEQTVELSRRLGYMTAVTADGGPVRRHDNPLCLRRVRPTKEVEALRWNLERAFARVA